MKWSRRFRARLRAVIRAARGAWCSPQTKSVEWFNDAPSNMSLLTVQGSISNGLLEEKSPVVAELLSDHFAKQAYHATMRQMGLLNV